jgi:SAM-dependent methyltransferase
LKLVSAVDPAAESALLELDARLRDYYNAPEIAAYYGLHHARNLFWEEESEHAVIRRCAVAGMEVVDFGCGSAHSYVNLRGSGVRYTGVDISGRQIEANRAEFGGASGAGGAAAPAPEFVAAPLYETGLESGRFDLTFSTYVIEHLVWPQRFLQEVVRVTRPGGRIVILCPHFRPGGRIPSFPYGLPVETLKERLRRGRVLAAVRHLYRRNVRFPREVRRRFPRERFPFLINLEPSCFRGAYYPDNDAVYLTDRNEIVAELERLGATDVTADTLTELRRTPVPGSCMIVARKKLSVGDEVSC